MRTTLTIDDNLDARVRSYARARHMKYKDAINEALERGLERLEVQEAAPDFVVESADFGLAPGVDPAKFNQLYDELESSGSLR